MGITTSCRARDQSKLRKDGSFLIFLPVSQNRAACGCYQGYAEGNIEDWEGKDQHSNRKEGSPIRAWRGEDVVEHQKQDSCRDYCQGAVEGIGQAEVMPQEEACGTD